MPLLSRWLDGQSLSQSAAALTFQHEGVVARVPSCHAMAEWNVVQSSDVFQGLLLASIHGHAVNIAVISYAADNDAHLAQ